MNRSERREILVRAAIDVIAEKGLSGTRVADIGERAGMSAGHVLYYFDGKGQIFTRAWRTVEEDLRAEVREAFESRRGARDRWEWLVRQAAPNGPGDPRILLWMEGWERAPRDPEVAALLLELEQRWIEMMIELLGVRPLHRRVRDRRCRGLRDPLLGADGRPHAPGRCRLGADGSRAHARGLRARQRRALRLSDAPLAPLRTTATVHVRLDTRPND